MLINLDSYNDILTVKEVCEILHIGSNSAYKLLNSGEIANFKIGSVRKIPKQSLCKYIESRLSDTYPKTKGLEDK